jgi:hypothetical protein
MSNGKRQVPIEREICEKDAMRGRLRSGGLYSIGTIEKNLVDCGMWKK